MNNVLQYLLLMIDTSEIDKKNISHIVLNYIIVY